MNQAEAHQLELEVEERALVELASAVNHVKCLRGAIFAAAVCRVIAENLLTDSEADLQYITTRARLPHETCD